MKDFFFALPVAALIALPAALPVAAQDVTLDTVVATVGDQEITMTHVLDVRRQLPAQYQSLPADQLFDGIVQQLVSQRALAASVESTPAWIGSYLENQEASVLAGIAVDAISAEAPSEEDLQTLYAEVVEEVQSREEFNASHILVETEEEAVEIIALLEGGADFAETAMEFSTGPSGPRGGELGWFGPGAMVPPFEEAVLALEPGETSPPVQTQFGWHVVRLNDLRSPEPPAFTEVQQQLAEEFQSQQLQAAIDAARDTAGVSLVDGIDANAINLLTLAEE